MGRCGIGRRRIRTRIWVIFFMDQAKQHMHYKHKAEYADLLVEESKQEQEGHSRYTASGRSTILVHRLLQLLATSATSGYTCGEQVNERPQSDLASAQSKC